MTLLARVATIAAVLLGAWGASALNAPVRLAGPFNLPDPLPGVAVLVAAALALSFGRRTAWPPARVGALLICAAGLLALLGLRNQLAGSPDGGAWGERFLPAGIEWTVALYALAAAGAGIGIARLRRSKPQ